MSIPKARPSRISAGRGLTVCPRRHKSDPSAHFCPICGLPKEQPQGKREEMTIRALVSSQTKFREITNHLSHGHLGESFEYIMSFMEGVVNGKASPEQIHEFMEIVGPLLNRTWKIVWTEEADIKHAIQKAAKELSKSSNQGDSDGESA